MKWRYLKMINEDDLRQIISEQAVEIINLRLENSALKRAYSGEKEAQITDDIKEK